MRACEKAHQRDIGTFGPCPCHTTFRWPKKKYRQKVEGVSKHKAYVTGMVSVSGAQTEKCRLKPINTDAVHTEQPETVKPNTNTLKNASSVKFVSFFGLTRPQPTECGGCIMSTHKHQHTASKPKMCPPVYSPAGWGHVAFLSLSHHVFAEDITNASRQRVVSSLAGIMDALVTGDAVDDCFVTVLHKWTCDIQFATCILGVVAVAVFRVYRNAQLRGQKLKKTVDLFGTTLTTL